MWPVPNTFGLLVEERGGCQVCLGRFVGHENETAWTQSAWGGVIMISERPQERPPKAILDDDQGHVD